MCVQSEMRSLTFLYYFCIKPYWVTNRFGLVLLPLVLKCTSKHFKNQQADSVTDSNSVGKWSSYYVINNSLQGTLCISVCFIKEKSSPHPILFIHWSPKKGPEYSCRHTVKELRLQPWPTLQTLQKKIAFDRSPSSDVRARTLSRLHCLKYTITYDCAIIGNILFLWNYIFLFETFPSEKNIRLNLLYFSSLLQFLHFKIQTATIRRQQTHRSSVCLFIAASA